MNTRGELEKRVPEKEIPPPQEIIKILEKFNMGTMQTKIKSIGRPGPRKIQCGPIATMEEIHNRTVIPDEFLTYKDLNLVPGPGFVGNVRATTQKLILNIMPHAARAIRRPPLTSFRMNQHCYFYSEKDPSAEKAYQPAYMEITLKTDCAYILRRRPENGQFLSNAEGQAGTAIVRASHLTVDCACTYPCQANNYEQIHYATICMPRECVRTYTEHEGLPKASNMVLSGNKRINLSMVYASEVSSAGTVLPQLIRRQSLSTMTRNQIQYYKSPFYKQDLRSDDELLCAILAQTNRLGFTNYTARITAPPALARVGPYEPCYPLFQ